MYEKKNWNTKSYKKKKGKRKCSEIIQKKNNVQLRMMKRKTETQNHTKEKEKENVAKSYKRKIMCN